MLRRAPLAVALLCILLASPVVFAATPSKGPFAGVVEEGGYRQHAYTNHVAPDAACPAWPWGDTQAYVVTLAYEPAVDRVDLHFLGRHAAGADGVARLTFMAPNCIRGTLTVVGVSTTAAYATYQVAVAEGTFVDY